MRDWDSVYQQAEIKPGSSCEVLNSNLHLLPNSGTALDYACGAGVNSIWLAQQGLQVTAVDASAVVVGKLNQYATKQQLPLHAIQQDLEVQPLLPDQYDLVLVSHFLYRPALELLPTMLKPGGLLFYQTYSGEQVHGQGPANPDYRFKVNELLQVYNSMHILFYREDWGIGNAPEGLHGQALMVAVKPG